MGFQKPPPLAADAAQNLETFSRPLFPDQRVFDPRAVLAGLVKWIRALSRTGSECASTNVVSAAMIRHTADNRRLAS
jgi:hypothetical protein